MRANIATLTLLRREEDVRESGRYEGERKM